MSATAQDKILAAALSRLEVIRRQEAFDPTRLESRPTTKQMEVITDFGHVPQQWIRAGNQTGKSQTCSRLVTWVLTDTHPYWKKPEEWNEEPLLIIVAGRTGKQIEESLLPKIKSYLEPGSYREVRTNNSIQKLELTNGNRIVFQSLENPNLARERLMSYVAHMVWIDELPPTLDLVRELLVRVQARNGYFLASFTPTVVNVDIQKYVDNIKMPEAKVYRFHMLDNPLYQDEEKREQLIRQYAYFPEDRRRAIFEGEWLSADDQVYFFDYTSMVDMPEGYSPLWRHVEAVDPAISSATGVTLWAENPATGVWYCILDQYIKNILVPTEIVQAVQNLTRNVNTVRRISDYAPWYVNTASAMGISYLTVDSKNANRKPELIKGLQQALGTRVKLSPHCTQLMDEINNCRWSSRGEGKIVNSSTYHLIDSAQYFCDVIPPPEKRRQSFTVDDWYRKLLEADARRQSMESQAQAQKDRKPVRLRRSNAWR
jgi:hypothetical protein